MIKLSEVITTIDGDSVYQNDKPGRPENTHASTKLQNGYPWEFEDPSGMYEGFDSKKIHQALIGREFQTLEDLRKIASRLRQRGFNQQAIQQFINSYLQ